MIESKLKFKILNSLNQKNNQGFTLIELLVVVIIIGVLAAIALPNLLSQVSKSRQTEAKINLGTINRIQQAYRFETGTFTTIANLPVTITSKYYNYANVGIPDAQGSVQTATVINTFEDELKDYTSAVGQTPSGGYIGIVCEQNNLDGSTAPISATVSGGIPSCTAGTTPVL
jgi:type IV pilus assembly protein PilA